LAFHKFINICRKGEKNGKEKFMVIFGSRSHGRKPDRQRPGVQLPVAQVFILI